MNSNASLQTSPGSSSMTSDATLDLLKLRIAVGALGERRGWWETSACRPEHKAVFMQLFPRTWRLASMNATAEAAKLVHQRSVTNRSQHLFRFHTELEQDLRRLMSGDDASQGARIFDEIVADPLAALKSLAEKGARLHEGAVSLGTLSRENILEVIPQMAGLYYAAFNNGTQCFPFFDPEVEE